MGIIRFFKRLSFAVVLFAVGAVIVYPVVSPSYGHIASLVTKSLNNKDYDGARKFFLPAEELDKLRKVIVAKKLDDFELVEGSVDADRLDARYIVKGTSRATGEVVQFKLNMGVLYSGKRRVRQVVLPEDLEPAKPAVKAKKSA